MHRLRIVSGFSLFCIALFALPLAAQSPEAAQRAAEAAAAAAAQAQQAAAEAAFKQMLNDSNARMEELLRDSRVDTGIAGQRLLAQQARERRRLFDGFQQAALQFQSDTEELHQSVRVPANLKSSAKKLEKTTTALLDYVKRTTSNHPRFDAAAFKEFNTSELEMESLKTARTIAPQLDTVAKNDNADGVDIQYLEALPKLESDLQRLQWMTRRLQ